MKFLYINFVVSLWVTAIATLAIGFFVLVRNLKSTVNRTFALYSFAITWWSFCQIWLIACDKRLTALIWTRIEQVGVFFIPTFFAHFVISLLNIKDRKRFLIFCYSLSTIFAFLCSTPLMMADAIPKETVKYVKYFATPGLAYHFAILFFVLVILRGMNWLYKEYRFSSGAKKNQLKYLFWSSLIGYFGGAANFLLVYGISIPLLNPFGTYALPVYIMVVAYSIVRFRLMDINLAITRAGIFIFVYLLVLGIPLGLTGWGKNWLEGLFGTAWYWVPIVLASILATAGPFIYIFLQRRAEDALFKERRSYQETINNLSESMVDMRDIDKLFSTITSIITEAVKIKFAVIYLKSDEYKSFQLKSCYPQEAKSRFQELIPFTDPLIGILDQRKKPSLGEEIGEQEKISLDSGVVIPCFGKDGLIGFIVLGAKQNNQMYTNDDLLVLETLSYNTSLAIENCVYWKQLEDKHRQERVYEMDLFSYSLAHEIDNPMSAIKTGIEWIRRYFINEFNPPPEKRAEIERYCNMISEMQQRVSAMVKAVEEFGSKTEGELIPLKVEDILTGFTNLYIPNFKHHGIYFSQELAPNIPFIRGVKQELEEVLVILANNAIYALKEIKIRQKQNDPPKVTIKVELSNSDWIRIIFSDNGEGIRKEDIKIIFNAFVTTKPSILGTGMGLYNALRIVNKHKGRIWAESEGKDKGASFIIELPIAKDMTEEDFKKEEQKKRIF